MTRPSPRGHVEGPGRERQAERLGPALGRLTAAFEAGRLRIVDAPNALEPELILVLEIAGEIDDFMNAVRQIETLEWLLEQTDEQVDPDEFAVVTPEGERKAYGRQLFVLASDAAAWRQLLRLWAIYRDGGAFPYGLTKFRDLFAQLRDLRPWDDRDRLLRAGAADAWLRDLVGLGDELIPFEIELWLRRDPAQRVALRDAHAAELREAGGGVVDEFILAEISYHGLLGKVPARLLLEAAQTHEVRWMSTANVRLFHPTGQAASPPPEESELSGPVDPGRGDLPGDVVPRVGLLDGLPIENHQLLAGRLVVDDPEGWGATTPVERRIHGTAMASITLHGDLSDPQAPPPEPVYVRPVLKYEAPEWVVAAREEIPADRLAVDVIHSAVVRMLEGDTAVAPSVRVVGISIGDPSQQFDRFISPWSRLLDWLAFRYRVLFLVSAGNHLAPLRVPAGVDLEEIEALEPEILEHIRREALSRRLLAPAESINALTIGAEHADSWGGVVADGRVDPLGTSGLPSVLSPTASGIRRSIKPEILLSGGRQLLRPVPGPDGPECTLELVDTTRAPGILVAAPEPGGGLDRTAFLCGTSGANALAARGALTILEQLDVLRDAWEERFPGPEFDAVLVKALLVHTARWGDARAAIASMLSTAGQQAGRAAIARFLGYGRAAPRDALTIGADTRITALYAAEILADDAHRFAFPLPPSLASSTVDRRLTYTLATLTPVNPGHRNYRSAAVWVEPRNQLPFFGTRDEADAFATRRGTLQHETLGGHRAVPYVDGDTAEFVVACRADAGDLDEPIPYALVVSLEVPIESRLPIYTEIRERLAIRVPVRPRG